MYTNMRYLEKLCEPYHRRIRKITERATHRHFVLIRTKHYIQKFSCLLLIICTPYFCTCVEIFNNRNRVSYTAVSIDPRCCTSFEEDNNRAVVVRNRIIQDLVSSRYTFLH